MKSFVVLATFLAAAFGAFSPFPIPIPKAGIAGLPRAPAGFSFVNLYGGGYVVGSSTGPAIGWLGEDGSWNPTVWVDTVINYTAYGTIQGVRFEESLTTTNGYGVVLVTRVNTQSVPPASALSAVDPFDWSTLWTVELGAGWAFDVDAPDASSYGTVFVTEAKMGGLWTLPYDTAVPTAIVYGNVSTFAPSNPSNTFGIGAAGIYAIDDATAVVSIGEPGVSKPRFYCLDAPTSSTAGGFRSEIPV